jgi:nucleotide-binding universal stress UspA family protein
MYKNVLAAVNEFSNSEIAAHYAIMLAGACRAKLILTFIVEEKTGKDKLRLAESAIDRLFLEAKEKGIESECIIGGGEPLEKITGLVRKHDIDIVFTATRREDVKKRFFVKTLSRQLMVKLPCSVAMVRVAKMGGVHLRNILVPLRGRVSGIEERAYFTAKLAEGTGAGITLIHTLKPIAGFLHGGVHVKSINTEQHIPRDMELFSGYLRKYSIQVEKKLEYGGIARAITMEAAFKRNDLIVMGASEKSLVSSIVKGNPVEDVLRNTPCNLIIFRARKR